MGQNQLVPRGTGTGTIVEYLSHLGTRHLSRQTVVPPFALPRASAYKLSRRRPPDLFLPGFIEAIEARAARADVARARGFQRRPTGPVTELLT